MYIYVKYDEFSLLYCSLAIPATAVAHLVPSTSVVMSCVTRLKPELLTDVAVVSRRCLPFQFVSATSSDYCSVLQSFAIAGRTLISVPRVQSGYTRRGPTR